MTNKQTEEPSELTKEYVSKWKESFTPKRNKRIEEFCFAFSHYLFMVGRENYLHYRLCRKTLMNN